MKEQKEKKRIPSRSKGCKRHPAYGETEKKRKPNSIVAIRGGVRERVERYIFT
jgi:hypothetical protein